MNSATITVDSAPPPAALTADSSVRALLGDGRIAGLVQRVVGLLELDWTADPAHLDSVCHYALLPGSKLFRPILLLESAAAVGGDVDAVLPAAAGAEAGHVASLIHDDIIDGDETRRGRPAVHVRYGRDEAIVAGDVLIFYLFRSLADCRTRGVSAERVASALTAVADAGLDLCRGQSMEAQLCAGFVCDVDAYLTMIRLKTAALFRASCACGSILAGGTPEQVQALADFGDLLGTAFQIYDDLLPYTSDSSAMGKAATSDIVNRRLTLPYLLAREYGGSAVAARLDNALCGDGDPQTRYRQVATLVRNVGALEGARQLAREQAESACARLRVLPSSASRSTLESFARAAVDRCA